MKVSDFLSRRESLLCIPVFAFCSDTQFFNIALNGIERLCSGREEAELSLDKLVQVLQGLRLR